MNKISLAARSVSLAAAMGLAVTVGAPAVTAQPSEPSVSAENLGNIDFTKTGSITLYKKKGEETNTPATGQEMEGVPGEGLAGVTFRATKLDYDLENGDWSTFPKMASEVKDENKTNVTYEQTTEGADGKAVFPGLELGIYLVEEIDTPEGIIGGAPFIVSVPMVNQASDSWNYDVIAYPKNTENEAVKSVEDADQNVQDAYRYTIEAWAPTFREDQTLDSFKFVDQLDPRLEFVSVFEVMAGGNLLEEGTDFTVTQPTEANGNTLEVVFTEAGLAKVAPGDSVTLQFDVKRTETGDSMALKNDAEVIFRNPNSENDVTTKTNETVTYHGNLKVMKKDAEETGKVLEGAKFELYQCESADSLGDKITIDNVSEWTTGGDGTFTIEGLHVTDYENGQEVTPVSKKYCLVETEAPAGYMKIDEPIEVDFKRSDIESSDTENLVTLEKEIDNVKQDSPELPMTGGMGIGILAAIGAALAAAGAWFARRGAKN